MNISHLQLSVVILVFMALYTFVLSSLRKEKFVVKEDAFVFGLGIFLWTVQLTNGILWVVDTSFVYVWCLVFWQFIPSVFLFGIAVLVSQSPGVTKGIAIRYDSALAKFLELLPLTGLNSSLCAFSWSNTFIIFLTPILFSAGGALLIIACLSISLFTLRAPDRIGMALVSPKVEFEDVQYRRFKNGFPMSPIVYFVPGLGIWEIYVSILHHASIAYISSWILYMVAVIFVYIIVTIGIMQSDTVDEDAEKEPSKPVMVLFKSLKENVCPRIYLP